MGREPSGKAPKAPKSLGHQDHRPSGRAYIQFGSGRTMHFHLVPGLRKMEVDYIQMIQNKLFLAKITTAYRQLECGMIWLNALKAVSDMIHVRITH